MDITDITKYCVIWCVLFGYSITANQHWCSIQCECYNDFETADCSRRGLLHLPEFSNLTKRIYAENNMIQEISYSDLRNLNHLLVFNLQNNSLTQVHFKAFCGFKSIIEINLSKNKINSLFTSEVTSRTCQLRRFSRLNLSYNNMKVIPENLHIISPQLEVLNLAYNDIHSIKISENFSFLYSLRSLDLSGNPIHEINTGDLIPLTNLDVESLKLSQCAIYNMSANALIGLENLTSLTLSGNLIFPGTLQQAFAGIANISRLQHLDLSEMMLPNVTAAMLKNFQNLVSLDISSSSIRVVQAELFTSLPRLDIINLQGNYLSGIDGINRVQSLRKLFLRDNRLKWINLTGLNNLEIVELSGNLFTTIPQYWLDGIKNLHFVNLSYNVIQHINHKAFQKVHLHTLDLSHNKLTFFHRYGLIKVENLYLGHNQLSYFSDNAFDNFEPILEKLDLSYNRFDKFPMLIDRDFRALQRLNLRHNNLGDSLQRGDLQRLFHSLSHLQVLDFSYNNIKIIPANQISNLKHLTTLVLEGNQITSLRNLGLEELNSIAKLVVSNNSIKVVDVNLLDNMDYLEEVDVSKNPFDCSCASLAFQEWLNITLIMVLNLDENEYKCESPSVLKSRPIQTVIINQSDCTPSSNMSLKFKLEIVGIVATFFALILSGLLACYYSKLCTQIKTLQYKWQVRYREVSAEGAEFGGEIAEIDQQDSEYLTVNNVFINKTLENNTCS